jgi:hypothetical protein
VDAVSIEHKDIIETGKRKQRGQPAVIGCCSTTADEPYGGKKIGWGSDLIGLKCAQVLKQNDHLRRGLEKEVTAKCNQQNGGADCRAL